MSSAAPSLKLESLARRFGPRWAVAGISMEIGPGTTWMLTGPNGSGKSTLLRLLATALRPHDGKVLWDGQPLWENRQALRPNIAFLGHALHVWDDLSPRDNLVAWARLGGLKADPDALLRRVVLDPSRPDPVRTLSAGMKRRLGLARLLLKKPRLALLDEPFGALDPEGRALVLEIVDQLRQGGSTVVIATHLADSARPVCTHHLALEAGRVVESTELGATA